MSYLPPDPFHASSEGREESGGPMLSTLAITLLVDNAPGRPGLGVEHGLSLWIEADDRRILFDTGQSDLVVRNATALGIDLRTADTIVLSHGHYDHTGGLAAVLPLCPDAEIYGHPGILVPRYSRQPDGRMKPIGAPPEARSALRGTHNTVHWITRLTTLDADTGITGPIPRLTAFEDTGGAFYLDAEGKEPDPIDDDLAMWFRTRLGLVVVTGCCHAGLVNTLTYVRSLTGEITLHTVLGGFHLVNATAERIDATCDHLQSACVERIVPCHCTGDRATDRFEERFGRTVMRAGVGLSFVS